MVLSDEQIKQYIDTLESACKKKVFLDALDYGNCLFINDDYNLDSIYIVVPVPEFQSIEKENFLGILIGLYNNDISTWIATRNYRSSYGTGTYSYDDSVKDIVDKSIKNAGICNFCKKPVGLANLSRVSFAGKACKDCLPGAKEKLEFRGWCD